MHLSYNEAYILLRIVRNVCTLEKQGKLCLGLLQLYNDVESSVMIQQ